MARDWVDSVHRLGPLISMIEPSNERSLRLARRLGATFERECEVLDTTGHIYRHPERARQGACAA